VTDTEGIGDACRLPLDLPGEEIAAFEWIEVGRAWREGLVPAELLTRYASTLTKVEV